MMKAFALFLFRLATGAYLFAWALVKLVNTERAIDISRTFYLGAFNDPAVQHGLAAGAAVLGIFAASGFLRVLSYPVQALVLGLATAAVGKAVIVVPVDLANGIEAATLLLPTLSVFLLSIAPLVWWKDDFLTLDRFIDWRLADLSREAGYGAALAAPVAMAAEAMRIEPTHEEPAHAEPIYAEPVQDEPAPVEAMQVEAALEPVEVAPEEPALVDAAPVDHAEATPIEAAHEGHAEGEDVEEAYAEDEHVEDGHVEEGAHVEDEQVSPALAAHAEHVDERAAHPVH